MQNLTQATSARNQFIPPLREMRARALVKFLIDDLGAPCIRSLDFEFYEEITGWFEWNRTTVDRAVNDAAVIGLAKLSLSTSFHQIEIEIPDEEGTA